MAIPKAVQKQADRADAILKASKEGKKPGEPSGQEARPAATSAQPAANANAQPTQAMSTDGRQGDSAQTATPPDDGQGYKELYEQEKQRFSTLQGMYRSEIDREVAAQTKSLSEKNSHLETELASLREKVEQLSLNQPNQLDSIKQEYGEDHVLFKTLSDQQTLIAGYKSREGDMMQQMKNLADQVQVLSGQVANTNESFDQITKADFFKHLDDNMADWEDVNKSPQFLEFLKITDKVSGQRYNELLHAARERLDPNAALLIYQTFKESSKTPTLQDNLKHLDIEPNHSGAEYVDGKRIWTSAEISQAYNDAAHGRISPEDWAKLEPDILAAPSENRLR